MASQTFFTTTKHWVDVQTSTGGVVTFSPVDGGGVALFSVIYAVQFTAELNTATMTAIGKLTRRYNGGRKL